MEYYYTFQDWLYQTGLYRKILREMSAPLNIIYFDTVLVLGLTVYVIYRNIKTIRIDCYHKRIRNEQGAGTAERLAIEASNEGVSHSLVSYFVIGMLQCDINGAFLHGWWVGNCSLEKCKDFFCVHCGESGETIFGQRALKKIENY